MSDTEQTSKSFWEMVLSPWGWFKWFVFLLISSLSILLFANYVLPKILETFNSYGMTIDSRPGGVWVISFNSKHMLINLPASTPWASTGIKVEKDEIFKITASGSVNLGLAKLVSSIDSIQTRKPQGQRPGHLWVDPGGLTFERKEPEDSPDKLIWRKSLILPNKPYGALVAGISSEDSRPGDEDTIWFVGKEWSGKIPKNGTLWFIVNDVFFRENHPELYPDVTPKQFYDIATQQKYWNMLYEDNIGSFMIDLQK